MDSDRRRMFRLKKKQRLEKMIFENYNLSDFCFLRFGMVCWSKAQTPMLDRVTGSGTIPSSTNLHDFSSRSLPFSRSRTLLSEIWIDSFSADLYLTWDRLPSPSECHAFSIQNTTQKCCVQQMAVSSKTKPIDRTSSCFGQWFHSLRSSLLFFLREKHLSSYASFGRSDPALCVCV